MTDQQGTPPDAPAPPGTAGDAAVANILLPDFGIATAVALRTLLAILHAQGILPADVGRIYSELAGNEVLSPGQRKLFSDFSQSAGYKK